MKRGRPSARGEVKPTIIGVLEESKIPLTISSIRRICSKRLGKELSWNTVLKYTRELVESRRLDSVTLPHSKKEGKDGLTVYILKK